MILIALAEKLKRREKDDFAQRPPRSERMARASIRRRSRIEQREGLTPSEEKHRVSKHLRQCIESDHFHCH
jgi:hypothetical protein